MILSVEAYLPSLHFFFFTSEGTVFYDTMVYVKLNEFREAVKRAVAAFEELSAVMKKTQSTVNRRLKSFQSAIETVKFVDYFSKVGFYSSHFLPLISFKKRSIHQILKAALSSLISVLFYISYFEMFI